MSYDHLIGRINSKPWACEEGRLRAMAVVIERRLGGKLFSDLEIQAAIDRERFIERPPRVTYFGRTGELTAAQAAGEPTGSVVAVLGLRGIISHRVEQVDDISGPGGTSTQLFAARFRQALADDAIGSIVIDVDSPGGSVDGVPELADEILRARGTKPIVAVANTLAASAAYWIATAADEVVVTPSGEVGSIGVWTMHVDFSKQDEMRGVKVTLIAAGKFKVEGNEFEPLSEDARAFIESRVDDYYDMFVRAVAKGRGMKVSDVRGEGFGQGRVVGTRDALASGMADRVETFDATLQRLLGGSRRRGRKASARHRFSF